MTMTPEETAIVLDRLGAALNHELSAEELEAWHAQLHACDPELAMLAADEVARTTTRFWPAPKDFHDVYAVFVKQAEAKQRRIEQGPVIDCECRATGWIEVDGYERNGHRYDNVVRPCEFCAPKAFEQWATQWKPDLLARRRRRRPGELLPADPRAGIVASRDELHRVEDILPNLGSGRL